MISEQFINPPESDLAENGRVQMSMHVCDECGRHGVFYELLYLLR